MVANHAFTWRTFGASVRGAAHSRRGLPNQDALSWSPRWSGLGPPVALCAADGHGSPRSFRSHIGATLAVRLARAELLRCAWPSARSNSLHLDWVEQFPRRLVEMWQKAVLMHLDCDPIRETELQALVDREGGRAHQALQENPFLAYGTTLLISLALPQGLIHFQLGDGDILAVSASGEVSRPVPADARLFANATTSLCATQAWKDFRVSISEPDQPPPALVLVTTDGYPNSFKQDAGFLQVGTDLLEMIQTAGIDSIQAHLPEWLTEASQSGSGDDISVGLLYHLEGKR